MENTGWRDWTHRWQFFIFSTDEVGVSNEENLDEKEKSNIFDFLKKEKKNSREWKNTRKIREKNEKKRTTTKNSIIAENFCFSSQR